MHLFLEIKVCARLELKITEGIRNNNQRYLGLRYIISCSKATYVQCTYFQEGGSGGMKLFLRQSTKHFFS